MYVTYQDLLLFCTFIVALISLLYQILKDKRK
ncbi:MAG: putative holin-like toxin [Lachnospiraceae bacterium]|nr:putative holin-like toxin [Lachnospiraceae bacterium]